MKIYKSCFGFREPYQVLVDGTFCQAAITNKAFVQQSIGFIFKGQVKFLTTPCVIKESEKLGSFMMGATILLKQCKIHYCHHKAAVGATDCLYSMLGDGNPCHYLVATQDDLFKKKLRKTPGVPIIYLHGKVAVLEKSTAKTNDQAEKLAKQRLGLSKYEEESLRELRASILGEETEPSTSEKRKREDDDEESVQDKKKKKKKRKMDEGEVMNVEPERMEEPGHKKNRKKIRNDMEQVDSEMRDAGEKKKKKKSKHGTLESVEQEEKVHVIDNTVEGKEGEPKQRKGILKNAGEYSVTLEVDVQKKKKEKKKKNKDRLNKGEWGTGIEETTGEESNEKGNQHLELGRERKKRKHKRSFSE
jgi:U3 small nucleolar RNA-associated protein 23